MTMHAQDIVGARVTSADGQVIGTVEQVFNDDADGTPVWAQIKAGRRIRFVPLGGSRLSDEGLSVPFETRRIIGGPDISADKHMSAAQAEQLSRYYGLTVPRQGGERAPEQATDTQARTDTQAAQRPGAGTQAQEARQAAPPEARQGAEAGTDWLVRSEERISVRTETVETDRVRLRKYVDVQPVEQGFQITREEYEVERVPIAEGEQLGDIAEGERELILHAERPMMAKEMVPVERVRLVPRQVTEDQTVRDEIRRERIEAEPVSGEGKGR